MVRILLVEDNVRYAQAAEQHLAPRGHVVTMATDYAQAAARLGSNGIDAVIADCFFPEATGRGSTVLGQELVKRMAQSDPVEVEMQRGLSVLGKYIDLTDTDAAKYARYYVAIARREGKPIEQSLVTGVLEALAASGMAIAKVTDAFKETIGLVYRESMAPKDYFGALMAAIEASEANQPLGVLVAERADELRIPLVLATSTYHHDILTQPVQNHAFRRGWTLVDCRPGEDDKASPEFWERVLSALNRQMGSATSQ